MSSIPARMKKIQIKMKALECSPDFSHYKSMGIFPDAQGQLTPQSLVRSGRISNLFEMLWMTLLHASRDQEDRQFPVLYQFRIRQTDLFREKRKKNWFENLPFFGRVPELKYSRSFEMVTKLHNPSLCLLSIIGQSSIIQRLSIDKDRYSLVSSH